MIIAFSRRSIGPVMLDCLLSEKHTLEVEITGNPIETGAEVNDHAYIKPKRVSLEFVNKQAAASLAALIRFQESRVPFVLVTGLNVYKDMLIQSIDATRDKDHASILFATVVCREVIIVSTATAPASEDGGGKDKNADSKRTSSTSSEKANNASTANRAAGSVKSGDVSGNAVAPAKTGSILSGVFK